MKEPLIIINDYSLEEFKINVEGVSLITPFYIAKRYSKLDTKKPIKTWILIDQKGYQLAIISKQLVPYLSNKMKPRELRLMEVINQKALFNRLISQKTIFIAYSPHYTPDSFIRSNTYKY